MPWSPGGSSSGAASAIMRAAASESKAKKKKDSGGGGIFGTGIGPDVNLGLEQVGKDIGGAFVGAGKTIYNAGAMVGNEARSVILNDPNAQKAAYENLRQLGEQSVGMASSLAGTASDVADVATFLPSSVARAAGLGDYTPGALIRKGTGAALGLAAGNQEVGQQYAPKPFMERVKERGLLSPIIEDVGNVALAGKGGVKLSEGGAALAEHAGMPVAAEKLTAIADRIRPLEHPLKNAYTNGIRPFTRAAMDLQAPEAAQGVAQAISQARAGADTGMVLDQLEQTHGPGARAAAEARLAPVNEPTPAMSQIAESRQAPSRAQQFVSRLPQPVQDALAKVENFSVGHEVKTANRQLERMAEVDRNQLMRTEGVQGAIKSVRELAKESGRKISLRDANVMIGDEIAARVNGVGTDLLTGASRSPEVIRSALEEGGRYRSAHIPDELMTPELHGLIDQAVTAWHDQAITNRERMLNESRAGDKGLENVDQQTPAMTKREAKLYRQALKSQERAAALRGRIPKEETALRAKIDAELERSQMLQQKIGDYQGIRNEAATQLDQLRENAPPPEQGGKSTIQDQNGQQRIIPDNGENPTPGSAKQLARRTPGSPDQTPSQNLHRGIDLGYKVRDIADANARIDLKIKAKATVDAGIEEMKQALIAHDLPSAVKATMLDKRAARTLAKLTDGLDNAPAARWPDRWKRVGYAIEGLSKMAEERPEVAAAMEGVPKTFSQVISRAAELGFDPEHVRQFRDTDVRRIIHDSVRLGKKGREGQEYQAGTRKVNTGQLEKAGAVDRSIEALAAAAQEVTQEVRSNQLVDFFEKHFAVPVKEGEAWNPKLYDAWDPTRSFLLTGKGALGKVEAGAGVQYIVPKGVTRAIHSMSRDFNNPIARGIAKATNPWRAFVLTLSPRWYVNNVLGNMMMSAAEGVKLQDWTHAWESYKKKDQAGHWADLPAIPGHSALSDIGEPSLIQGSIKDAWQNGETRLQKVGNARKQVSHRLRRANEVVDEFARAAAYHHSIRTSGLTGEAAVAQAAQRAYEAQVDYGNLSPIEQNIVRAVVPFYAWQKGILKLVSHLPIDHPIAAGLTMQLGEQYENKLKDQFGGMVPLGYSGLINLPGGGALNTRGANPFQDSLSLVTPDGIANSMNPFIQLGVRKVLGAPEGGFIDQYRMDPYGLGVPDVSVNKGLGDIAKGLPLVQEGMAISGSGTLSAGNQSLRTAGIPYMGPESVQKAIDRAKAAQYMMSHPGARGMPKKKASTVPGVLGGGSGWSPSKSSSSSRLPWQRGR